MGFPTELSGLRIPGRETQRVFIEFITILLLFHFFFFFFFGHEASGSLAP